MAFKVESFIKKETDKPQFSKREGINGTFEVRARSFGTSGQLNEMCTIEVTVSQP